MAVACPYCSFIMELVGMKVGRYTPACQQCRKKFLIVIPEPVVKTWEEAVAEAREVRMAEIGAQAVAAALGNATLPAERKRSQQHETQPTNQETALAATAAPAAPTASVTAAGGREVGATAVAEPAHGARHARQHPGFGAGAGARHPEDDPTNGLPDHHPVPMPALEMPDVPEMLGGYKIDRKLGEGGMGAVYLATQLSLDRPVAVKVMNRQWARDAEFVARFTREAYAAAQLTHHNVVQIHDIGVEGDVHYFSMEYVPGKSLAGLVKDQKRLDPEEAAGYALQAARGLKFAHDHGMIHRDIKPENLLVNDQGIVKVMDLGLVKTPEGGKERKTVNGDATAADAGKTQMNVSMGTPLYMSPEQAQDAASVDARADVYSLGCTLYDLVVGRPPFEGRTVMEVLTKHAREPVVPPDVLVKRVPHGLSEIVQNMVAKKKEERIESMDGVIRALEAFLGINSAGPFTPREEHAKILELAVRRFNKSSLAGMRRNLVRMLVVLGLLGLAAGIFLGSYLMAGAVAGMLVLTPLFYQVIVGVTRKTHVFTRVRQLAFGASIVDWLKFAGLGFVAIALLWVFGLLWVWIGVAVAAAALACAFAFGLDMAVRRQRKPEVDRVLTMLKAMRLKGLEEEKLRQFVCRYSEENWEEFYETLFGYEAKMRAREAWGRGDGGRARRKFGSWRDGIVSWAERRMKHRQEERERAVLEKLEEKRLRATGASESDARRKAKEAAEWMVGQAASVKEHRRLRVAETAAPGSARATAAKPTSPVAPLLALTHDPTEAEMHAARREQARVAASRTLGGGLGMMLLGPHVRFGLGVVALLVCLLWLNQNGALNAEKVRGLVLDSFEGGYAKLAVGTAAPQHDEPVVKRRMAPLQLPVVSNALTMDQRKLLNRLTWGLAGILLLVSSLWRGVKISFLMIPAALLVVCGELLGIPAIMGFAAWQVASLAGFALALMAYWFGREVGA